MISTIAQKNIPLTLPEGNQIFPLVYFSNLNEKKAGGQIDRNHHQDITIPLAKKKGDT